MSDRIGDDLRKIMMAGVGAFATLGEKSKEWIDEMSKKGEESAADAQPIIDDLAKKGAAALEQGKAISEEMKKKLQHAIDGVKTEAQQLDLDDMMCSLQGLTDDALDALKEKLDKLIDDRAQEEAEPSVDEAPES